MFHIDPPRAPIEGPCVWYGADLRDTDEWCHELDGREVQELESAADRALATGKPLLEITRDDFPLTRVAELVDRVVDDLEDGRGFVLIRGLPMERYSVTRAAWIYWGMSQHLGIPVAQNGVGATLSHVRDQDPGGGDDQGRLNLNRGYTSRRALTYHTDSSDVVGLLCLHPAKQGGISTIVSSTAIHNELLRTRPELLDLLYQPYPQGDRNPDEPDPTEAPYDYSTGASFHAGKLSWRGKLPDPRWVAEHPELGCMAEAVAELRSIIDDLADRWHLDMGFRAGDIQYLNNYSIMHSRTAFEDHDDPAKRRDLLRIWLTLHRGRELADNFGRRPGRRDAWGGRGGMRDARAAVEV